MRFLGTIFLIGVLAFLGWGIYNLSGESRTLEKRSEELKTQIDSLKASTGRLESEIKYYSLPENLEKEAKSQFNYINPGESLIILVPGTSTNE